jgi:la-related protein 1
MNGLDKIIIALNRTEISNFSQFIQRLNEIYSDYGIIDKITDKDGFQIKEFNHLQIDNIWNYLSNNDIINIYLRDNNIKNINIPKLSLPANDDTNTNDKKKLSKMHNKSNKKNSISLSISSSSSHYSYSSSSSPQKCNKKKNSLSSSSSSSSSNSSSSHRYTKKKNSKKYINCNCSSSSSLSGKNKKYKRKPSDSRSSSPSISKHSDKNNKSNGECYKVNIKDKNMKKNKIILNKDYSNDSIKKNYEKNYQLLGQKRKLKNFQKIDYSSIKTNKRKKNQKFNNNNNNNKVQKEINYELIPSNSLDDISFLQKSYPKLFNQGTNIKFKIQELLKNGIGIGDYHYGIVDNFNLENKSFLIKNCNSMNEKTMMFMYQYDEDLLCVQMKDFVELWLESDSKEKMEENNNNYNIDIDEDLTKHFIQRQIEYYFSDANYEKDSFLKSKEDENGYIPISLIMSFNKIKMITKDKTLFINALKEKTENKLYEFNEDFSKIRKIKSNENEINSE